MLTESDRLKQCAAAQLGLSPCEAQEAIRRWRVLGPYFRGDFSVQGFATATAYVEHAAGRDGAPHSSSIWRWIKEFGDSGHDPRALVRKHPGPPEGTGSLLDGVMRAFLREQYLVHGKGIAACHRELVRHLSERTDGSQAGMRADAPSYYSVSHFLRRLRRTVPVTARRTSSRRARGREASLFGKRSGGRNL